MYASDSPEETFKFAKDAISCGAFSIAHIFTRRLRELAYEAPTAPESKAIYEMLVKIRERME